MSRRTGSLLLGVALWSLSLFAALPAHAAVTCDFTGEPLLTVTLDAGDSVTIVRGPGATGAADDDELVVGAGTGDCTQLLDDVERVVVNGSAGNDTLTFSLAGGLLENIATFGEPSSAEDIEFLVNLAGGTDTIDVVGSGGNDVVRFGDEGMNLNDDGDADVANSFTGDSTAEGTSPPLAEIFSAHMGAGEDDFFATGAGAPVDGEFPQPIMIFGEAGDDELEGGDGDDVINGGPDADDMHGWDGKDTADYSERTNPVSLSNGALHSVPPNAGLGNDGEGSGCFPTLVDGEYEWDYSLGGDVETACENDIIRTTVENLRGGSNDDFLFGNTDANKLEGQGGNDELIAGSSPDVLVGGTGDDIENGGGGADRFDQGGVTNGADQLNGGSSANDIADYSARTAVVNVNLTTPDGDGQAGEDDNVMGNVERLEGGSNADVLTADDGPDKLFGNTGADLLRGGTGNDKLIGGDGADDERGDSGNDTFFQGSSFDGNDSIRGGLGSDIVKYESFGGTARANRVVVDVDGSPDDGEVAAGENDNVRTDIEKIYGGNGNDTLTGNADSSWLYGQDGDDTLNGRDGADHLFGGAGADEANGGANGDEIRGGGGPDTLNGGDGNDRIFGDDGGDTIDGGAGDRDLCELGADGSTKSNCER